MAVLAIGGGLTLHGYFVRAIRQLKGRPQPDGQQDTVVVSATLADGKPLRDLNARLDSLDTTLSTLGRCVRLQTEEQARSTDATRDLKELLHERLPRP